MGKNKNQPKQRNYVVKKMIERSQNAGYHLDKRREAEKYRCREGLDDEELEELEEALEETEAEECDS